MRTGAVSVKMEFIRIEKEELAKLAPYFSVQPHRIGDFSVAFQFMWYDALKPAFAIVENCLVIREFFAGKCYFHFPPARRTPAKSPNRPIWGRRAYTSSISSSAR